MGTRTSKAGTADASRQQAADLDKVHVFISYASADREVANVLFEELTEINRDRVVCFLDTKSIESGDQWQPDLERALRRADWLVCVFTGVQSEFCGYEVGVFAQAHATEVSKSQRDTRIVCLHNVEQLPGIFKTYQTKLITAPAEPVVAGAQPDERFYLEAPIAKFLNDFYRYKALYVARDVAEGQRQQQTLVRQARRISEAFNLVRGREEKSSTPTQLGLEVKWKPEGSVIDAVPDAAEVSGTFQTLGLFGLMPSMRKEQLPRTTWGRLRSACQTPFRADVPWMEKIERDMILAANEHNVGTVEATFKSRDNKIYQAILARRIEYFSGVQLFSVLFVETLPRRFLGKRNTSMLLAGLVLASRFRFNYLEEKDEVLVKRFGDRLSNSEFESSCRQLRYDIEQMTHEAADFGLLDPDTFIKAFGPANRARAESFLANWAETEGELYRHLPRNEIRISDANRAQVKQAVAHFIDSVEVENEKFLLTAIDVFRSEVLQSFPSRPTIAAVPASGPTELAAQAPSAVKRGSSARRRP